MEMRVVVLALMALMPGCQGETVQAAHDSSVPGDSAAVTDTALNDGSVVTESSVVPDSSVAMDSSVVPDSSALDVGTTDGDRPSDPKCGTHGGGPMVFIPAGNFCIDAREVTRGEYAMFVVGPKKPPPFCDWNDAWEALPPTVSDQHPVSGIDWCDAYEYCESVNKHLCGGVADGKVGNKEGPVDSQWSFVCTNGGNATVEWATGSAPGAGVCHIASGDFGPAPVNTYPLCRGTKEPYARVLDMCGNVREWDGSGCPLSELKAGTTPTQRAGILCGTRGGYYDASVSDGRCVTASAWSIANRNNTVGVRCCKQAT